METKRTAKLKPEHKGQSLTDPPVGNESSDFLLCI